MITLAPIALVPISIVRSSLVPDPRRVLRLAGSPARRRAAAALALTALFIATIDVHEPRTAHADGSTLVLRPGEKATIGNPYKELRMGNIPLGETREVFLHFTSVDAGSARPHVLPKLARKAIQLVVADDAPAGIYTVVTKIRVEQQIRRQDGRRAKWVKFGTKENTEQFTLVVDLGDPPDLRVPTDSRIRLTLPPTVFIDKVRSQRKPKLEVGALGNVITFEGKEAGKSKVTVQYSIGGVARSQTWKVEVDAKIPRLEKTLRAATTHAFDLAELTSKIDHESLELLDFDIGPLQEIALVRVLPASLQIDGVQPGEGTGYLRVRGKSRRDEEWIWVPVALTITSMRGSDPKPEGGGSSIIPLPGGKEGGERPAGGDPGEDDAP